MAESLAHTKWLCILELWNKRPELQKLCRDIIVPLFHTDKAKEVKAARLNKIESFLTSFSKRASDCVVFDDSSFRVMVDRIVVTSDLTLSIQFIDGACCVCSKHLHF